MGYRREGPFNSLVHNVENGKYGRSSIEHVSDTALLVAASRARESARLDGLIHDSFASRLAGDRGMAMLNDAHTPAWMELGISLRTHMLDDLLAVVLAGGVDTVLNLGAGLDIRPWRLDLPASLRWIEVDFLALLDYKYAVLEDETPHCSLERRSADLNQPAERQAVIEEASSGARNPLMISEGLLMYLPADSVHALAIEARSAGIRYWLLDSTSPSLMRRAHGDAVDQVNRVRADSHLEGPQIREAIEQHSWKPIERRLFQEEGPKLAMKRIVEIIQSEGRAPAAPPDDESGVSLFHLEA